MLGRVKKIDKGAFLQSSSIHLIPSTSQTLPISCESQKIVVVPFNNDASAYAQPVIILLSICICGSINPGAKILLFMSYNKKLSLLKIFFALPVSLIHTILPLEIQISLLSIILSV